MKNLVVLSGAGISAESGIKTFRDAGGLWEGHDIMEVASPQGWKAQPELVSDFYNKRRLQLREVSPNAGHLAVKEMEQLFDVKIITQNVDDLHERAGSTYIVHLHGELTKMRSVKDENAIVEVGYESIEYGRTGVDGHLLRPHIVWFGEEVPNMPLAWEHCAKADLLLVVGTSLEVYPAASLIHAVNSKCKIFIVDPGRHEEIQSEKIRLIRGTAAEVLPELLEKFKLGRY